MAAMFDFATFFTQAFKGYTLLYSLAVLAWIITQFQKLIVTNNYSNY